MPRHALTVDSRARANGALRIRPSRDGWLRRYGFGQPTTLLTSTTFLVQATPLFGTRTFMTLTAAANGSGGDSPSARNAERLSDSGAAPSDVSPRISMMETVEEVRRARTRLRAAALTAIAAWRAQLWNGPSVRAGLAEEIGGRRNLEDACVALDDAAELAVGDQPCGFYAVRGHD